jgi:hypothetical protein
MTGCTNTWWERMRRSMWSGWRTWRSSLETECLCPFVSFCWENKSCTHHQITLIIIAQIYLSWQLIPCWSKIFCWPGYLLRKVVLIVCPWAQLCVGALNFSEPWFTAWSFLSGSIRMDNCATP